MTSMFVCSVILHKGCYGTRAASKRPPSLQGRYPNANNARTYALTFHRSCLQPFALSLLPLDLLPCLSDVMISSSLLACAKASVSSWVRPVLMNNSSKSEPSVAISADRSMHSIRNSLVNKAPAHCNVQIYAKIVSGK